MYGFEKVATRARSSVRPIPDMAMSNLSAARSASIEPNVIFTYSSLTPSEELSVSRTSMSRPWSFPVAGSRMLNTGVSIVVPTRNTPRSRIICRRSGVWLSAAAGNAAMRAVVKPSTSDRRFIMVCAPVSRLHLSHRSVCRPAAVEDKRRTGHQRRGGGGEEGDRAGQLFELAEAGELDLGEHLVAECLVLEGLAIHRRYYKGRSQAVDADVVGRKLDRHRLGEAFHGVLAGAIDGAACGADMAHLRRDVDDGARAFGLDQAPRDCL